MRSDPNAIPTGEATPSTAASNAGADPAEGRPDMGIPGANRPELPPDPDAELPERLSERIYGGGGEGIATGEPDLKPDVEVPESTM